MSNNNLKSGAGIIVFSQCLTKTILVTSKNNKLSFPKGKRKKRETDYEAALRELEEETGIVLDQIELVDDVQFTELFEKKNKKILYFMAICKEEISSLKCDSNELQKSDWYLLDKAVTMRNLRNPRRKILKNAINKLNNIDNSRGPT